MTTTIQIENNDSNFDFKLGIDAFNYSDLYNPFKLKDLAETFYNQVKTQNPELHDALIQYIEAKGNG